MIDVFFRGYGYWIEACLLDPSIDPVPDDNPNFDKITTNELTSGVFRLSESDEMAYKHSQSFNDISYLLPSTHPDSAFSVLRDAKHIEKDCQFNIDTSRPMKLCIAKPYKLIQLKTTVTATERQTLLKIILAMAIDGYKYDPASKKNSATGNNKGSIKCALERIGLNADEKTISKYLKEAAEQYPDAKPHKT